MSEMPPNPGQKGRQKVAKSVPKATKRSPEVAKSVPKADTIRDTPQIPGYHKTRKRQNSCFSEKAEKRKSRYFGRAGL